MIKIIKPATIFLILLIVFIAGFLVIVFSIGSEIDIAKQYISAPSFYKVPIKDPITRADWGGFTIDGVSCEELYLPVSICETVNGNSIVNIIKYSQLVGGLAQNELNEGDEYQLAYIKKVYTEAGSIYIDADYFKWLSHSDGSCILTSRPMPDISKNPPDCNPNGFLIWNENPQIRSFVLSKDVRIRMGGLQGLGDNYLDLRTLTPVEFMNGEDEYGNKYYAKDLDGQSDIYYVPFQLIMKDGQVKFIHQIYVP